MRIGILTGGGDCQGLNAAIRAVAKSLMLNNNAEIIGIEDGFDGLLKRKVRQLSYADCSGILPLGGTILGTSNKANPFDYQGKDCSQDVQSYYQELGLDAIVMIGGDGTMSIAYELTKLGMNIVGVPKTIDNDLMCTERTFGFETAVSIVTEAIDRLRTTGHSHKRIMILETMGRYAGWIALHAGVAGGADVILIPEFPYNLDEIVSACELRASDQHYSIIVIAEGSKPENGSMAVQQTISDSPDPIRLGGISNVLKSQLEKRLSIEVRATSLGHIQRGGSPTANDRIFATNVGTFAAKLVTEKQFGRVVVQQNNQLTSVPLEQVANQTKGVSVDDLTLQSAISLGISFGVAKLEDTSNS
ncbi:MULTISPECIES: 6-phosphofructokinase [Aliiglaciecola]|uniref:6-phosphofructokinase n=1 Tax=Aliiglaciecola TaxID=1406885 RepID=UPI001C093EB1|nr:MULTISPECIES: ATP-dependent 6-phosphofructokinase [Aliiglaciecola]MBU2878257.1 ATP-dependent 6-phosphofructokinase [Aliiglaciecola lipolytica]MDO6711832.1 ATP-dependent 6-phosphofructokinase [Aliiglaciecola sp. 2_MG-2023]MDO6752994.1 ATP-dependent 6-phosphofructokinase [Aliiglaciecola sp. 1_MG-2023]